MQDTKLADAGAPITTLQLAGYEFAHHGKGDGTESRSQADAALAA
ncbi:MAG: hypothetical protein QM706_02265 [Nitrospira sp.]